MENSKDVVSKKRKVKYKDTTEERIRLRKKIREEKDRKEEVGRGK